MLGYLKLLGASANFKEEDLAVEKEMLVENFLDNPFGQLFCLLSNLLIPPSAEAIDPIKSTSRTTISLPTISFHPHLRISACFQATPLALLY
jgi:hypothetical protein